MTLSEFELYVDNVLIHNTPSNRESLLLNLQKHVLIKLLENILENKKDIDKISKQSYKHNNGFDKILLLDNRPYYSIRLHLWNKDKNNSNIHNHEWDLSGIVLYGSYNWKLYSIVPNSYENLYQYTCNYNNNYSGHKFLNEKVVNVKKYLDITISKNSIYSIDGDIYHKISNNKKEEASSLIIHSNVNKESINIMSNERLESSIINFNKNYSSDELKNLLSMFIINFRK